MDKPACWIKSINAFKPPRSEDGSLREEFPQAGLGLKSRARCAGFSVTEIGNRKERLRDYASFPDRQPNRNPRTPQSRSDKKTRIRKRSET